jgi:hypothetical protein
MLGDAHVWKGGEAETLDDPAMATVRAIGDLDASDVIGVGEVGFEPVVLESTHGEVEGAHGHVEVREYAVDNGAFVGRLVEFADEVDVGDGAHQILLSGAGGELSG